ncbi:MAG: GuaB1 family IMP dehydrogenase-related protein [Proteobacteria bacterium]|nr:GuaB1 family IMP dehydrogenase-related protein [Pseudomonadota bacterium]
MRFLHPQRDAQLELSLDDVFILPGRLDGTSRLDVDLTPIDFAGTSHPVVSANMNAVTGKRMAETIARFGGVGILPQDMDLATVERIIAHVKKAPTRYDTALVVTPRESLRDVQGIIRKRAHGMVLVVDGEYRLLGVITQADLRQRDQYTPAEQLMSRTLVTISPTTSHRDAFLLMEEKRVKAAPVVDGDRRVKGILTRDDAVRYEIFKPSLNDSGELMIGAAVGISTDAPGAASALVDMGIDVLVIDTAHGHQRRMLEVIARVSEIVDGRIPLVAGNVCTAEGTRELVEAGADIIKVNVGPGAMCTTRMQTGVGRPSFTSVAECAREAGKFGKYVWADGGVRYPRDVALYLAAGAARVMVGTMFAGTYESPGDIQGDRDGHLYKENYGMASSRAVADRTSDLDPFERAKKGFFREGISSSRIYINEGRESVGALLVDIITGVQSAFTYCGALTCREFTDKAIVGVQTSAGFHEGKPHGEVVGEPSER